MAVMSSNEPQSMTTEAVASNMLISSSFPPRMPSRGRQYMPLARPDGI